MLGKTISHYRILEKLGEGGMGVVYKAEDTRLERVVAIKFLPHHIAANAEERERFKIEAKAAAALNHPNIATIHAIEEVDGEMFIVMEFIDGKELRELLIDNGQLSIDNCLAYATQIAAGLQAAHAKGITHRDIKSSNIMVTESGQVKIMDFGLAKIGSGAHLTKSGMTLGTAAYMSPEQARGEPVDHRTDIWSFGVVLYEMLTRQLPFRGEYEQAIMYAIVNEEPEPVQKYLPEASPELLHVLDRALEKVSDDRYQSVNDMLIDLRRLKKETGRVSHQLPGEMKISEPRAAMVEPRSSRRNRWLSLGALAVLAIVVSVLLLLPQHSTELNPNITFRVLPIPYTQISYPGLSPDGNWLVFPAADASGKWGVYLMNTSGGESRRITADSSDFIENVDISPDSAYVIFDHLNIRLQKTEVHIVSSLGGTSKIVVGHGALPKWRPDGQRVGYIVGSLNTYTYSKSGKLEFWSVKPDGSDNRLEFVDSTVEGYIHCSVSWSPDRKSVVWIRTFPEGHAEVIVRELGTGKERQLTFDKKMIDEVCWTPNDQIIFSSNKSGNTNLWMVPANGGQAVQITKGSGPDIGMKISTDGKKLVYLQQQLIGHLCLAKIDGSSARQIISDERKMWGPFFSPDGKRLLVCMGDPDISNHAVHLYAMNRDGSNRQQINSGDQVIAAPRWSSDGKWIAYSALSTSEPFDSARVYLVEASNLGNPRLLSRGFTWCWFDSQSFIVRTMSNSWLLFVDGTAPRRLSEDSTFAIPVFGEKHVLLQDLRKGREGWWMASTTDWRSPATRPLKKIFEFGSSFALAPSRKFLLSVKNIEELWKITLPDGKAQRLPGTFPFLTAAPDLNVSYNGQEIVWVDLRRHGKLVMLENLFK